MFKTVVDKSLRSQKTVEKTKSEPTRKIAKDTKLTLKELAMKPTPIKSDRKPEEIRKLEEDREALLALFSFYDQDQNGFLQRQQLK